GQPLKQLGMGGRELKNQAQAYLANATDSAAVTRLASENESLKAQLAELRSEAAAPATQQPSPFDDMDAETLKSWIADASGQRPRGNPSHETLVRMASEINDQIKAKKEAA